MLYIPKAGIVQIIVFWDVKRFRLLDIYRRVGQTTVISTRLQTVASHETVLFFISVCFGQLKSIWINSRFL